MPPDQTPSRSSCSSDGSALDELVFAVLERIEAEGSAAIDAVCRENPALAVALRARIAALRAAGLIDGLQSDAGEPDSAVPERLGDFLLRERIGGGGMGVVYRAEQVALQREVALKLIRPEQLYFGGARRRFAREVAAVARLSHPGIAAVHTVGEQDGLPFFAMELVEGVSLAEAVCALASEGATPSRLRGSDLRRVARRGSAGDEPDVGDREVTLFRGRWVDTCLRVALQIAEALQHAHGHGVLHRDVKPSNVMLTPGGRVLLVDFGLASSSEVDRLTRTGSQLGSAPYMPPETASGASTEPAVTMDVYSLGVTLYELLTLRLPFAAHTTHQMLTAITEGHAPRPREHNRNVSAEVEVVCLTAMDPDPARRYSTAGAFARDLTNALERRPIEARSIGRWLRLRRWAQRNPAHAVAAGLAVLLVVGGPTALAVQQSLARARLAEALALAEENFAAANDAVDFMLTQVADKSLIHIPQMEAVRRRLLERALEFHRRFLNQKSDDFSVRLRAAMSHYRVGLVRRELGELALATAAHEESIRRFKVLLEEQPNHAPAWSALARARGALAYLHVTGGSREEGLVLYEAVLEDLAKAIRCAPEESSLVRTRVTALMNTGITIGRVRGYEAALPLFAEALGQIEPLVARGDAPNDVFQHASVLAAQGTVLGRMKRSEEAMAAQRQAVAELAELVSGHEHHRSYRTGLASAQHNLGVACMYAGSGDEAEKFLLAGAKHFRKAIENHPHDPRTQRGLGLTLSDLSYFHLRQRDYAAARGVLEQTMVVLHEVLSSVPDDVQARPSYEKNQRRMASVLVRFGDHEALADLGTSWAEVSWCDAGRCAFFAGMLARAMTVLAKDTALSPRRRDALESEYRQRGLALLRRAVDGGWRDAAALAAARMAPLRGTAEFAALAERVAADGPQK